MYWLFESVRTVATVYGLHFLADEKGNLSLTYPLLPSPRTLSDLSTALRAVLPEHYARYQDTFFIRFIPSFKATSQFQRAEFLKNSPVVMIPQDKMAQDGMIAAMKQIRTEVEPLLARPSADKIPFADSPQRSKNSLAVLLLLEAWLDSNYATAARPTPVYITRFDEMYLVGGPFRGKDGKSYFNMTAAYPDKDGKMVRPQGFSQAFPHSDAPSAAVPAAK